VILSTALAGVLIALPTALPAVGAASPDRGISGSEVVIRPGESLWSVAARHAPDRDPTETVEEIRRLNRLSCYLVYPGQQLRLP
jgi:LysM repeat protein